MEKIRKVISQLLVCVIILSGVVLIPNTTAEWFDLDFFIMDIDPTCYEVPFQYDDPIYLMSDKRLPTFVIEGYIHYESDNRNDYMNGTLLFYLTKRTGEYVLNLLKDSDYSDGIPFPLWGGACVTSQPKLEVYILRGEIESGKYNIVMDLIDLDTGETFLSDYCHITLKNYFVEDSPSDTTDNNTDSDQTGDSDIPVDTTPDYDNDPKKGIFGFTTAQFSIIAFLLLIVALLSILLYSNFRKKQY